MYVKSLAAITRIQIVNFSGIFDTFDFLHQIQFDRLVTIMYQLIKNSSLAQKDFSLYVCIERI